MSRMPLRQHPARFDLRQLRAFLVVADQLHFSRAAEDLSMTQPAVSRMIRKVEDAVGASLFERSTRKVRLTAAGEAFAAECRLALNHLDLASQAAHNAAEGREGRLRVGYMDFAINGSLPSMLRSFREHASAVSMTLEYMPTTAQHVALLEGRIDIGFVVGALKAQKVSNLLVEEQQFVALVPERHRLASRPSVPLAELEGEPFVMGSEDAFASFRPLVFDLCHAAGFFPNIVQEASNSSGIFGLVAAGVGVSIYSDCVRSVRRAGTVVKALSNVATPIPIFATWVGNHAPVTLARFIDTVRACVRASVTKQGRARMS